MRTTSRFGDNSRVGGPPPRGPATQSTTDAGRRSLSRRECFDRVVARLGRELEPPLNAFRTRPQGHLLKIHYDNERVHYEIWIDGQRGHIELGLHFEDGPASTAAYLRYFDNHIVELKHLLGTGVDLERWTVSWGHLYEIVPLGALSAATADRLGHRLAELIRVLEPLRRDAAVPRERVDAPVEHRQFRRRSRA
jgi:hypothetical protein